MSMYIDIPCFYMCEISPSDGSECWYIDEDVLFGIWEDGFHSHDDEEFFSGEFYRDNSPATVTLNDESYEGSGLNRRGYKRYGPCMLEVTGEEWYPLSEKQ